jgi:hypothetical protein
MLFLTNVKFHNKDDENESIYNEDSDVNSDFECSESEGMEESDEGGSDHESEDCGQDGDEGKCDQSGSDDSGGEEFAKTGSETDTDEENEPTKLPP